jgi:hypothetical protein
LREVGSNDIRKRRYRAIWQSGWGWRQSVDESSDGLRHHFVLVDPGIPDFIFLLEPRCPRFTGYQLLCILDVDRIRR